MTEQSKGKAPPPAQYDGEILEALTAKLDENAIRARKMGIALLGLSHDDLITGLAITGALLDIATISSKLMSERASQEERLSGIAFELLRKIDTFGQRGKKVIEGAAKGHAAVHGDPKAKQKRSEEYQEEIARVIQKNAALSWSAVCMKVGETFGVAARTVSRNAIDPRK